MKLITEEFPDRTVTNPEEFLRDYDAIKDTLCYQMATT